jgi:hypothetical protein
MSQMIRKHFLLPLLLDEWIKLVARRDQKSEAEVIRELLAADLETKPAGQRYFTATEYALYLRYERGED